MRASDKQIRALRRHGIWIPDDLTLDGADLLLRTVAQRQASGLATYRQLTFLLCHGLSGLHMTEGLAAAVIEGIGRSKS